VRYVKNDGRWQIAHLLGGFDAPFWKMPIEEMSSELKELFGITSH